MKNLEQERVRLGSTPERATAAPLKTTRRYNSQNARPDNTHPSYVSNTVMRISWNFHCEAQMKHLNRLGQKCPVSSN